MQELIIAHKPDFISISESNKEDFTPLQLEAFDSRSCYTWKWLPANNTAGGILVGIRGDLYDIV